MISLRRLLSQANDDGIESLLRRGHSLTLNKSGASYFAFLSGRVGLNQISIYEEHQDIDTACALLRARWGMNVGEW